MKKFASVAVVCFSSVSYLFRFFLVFLDADGRPLFVSAQRGIIDAKEFDKEMSKRNSMLSPAFPFALGGESDWSCEELDSNRDVPLL